MNSVIDWLMEGDPVIRWQTMRDLAGASEAEWQAERRITLEGGWGARFLECLLPDGTWPTGRWTGTVWTLLTVMDCGLPAETPELGHAARLFLDRNLTLERANDGKWLQSQIDLCHVGFWLRIGAYFLGNDPRLSGLTNTLLHAQLADGAWNCRIRNYPKTSHSSFHTSFNVLEGLQAAAEANILSEDDFRLSEARALEFMLAHRMYRSDKTGEIVNERFTHLAYPSHWHYTVLRGLDYMRHSPEIADERLEDPLGLLISRRNANGRWPVEKRIAGTELFDMERMGSESRWNTLRALRVLKYRQTPGS
jgi:hypothetical protein